MISDILYARTVAEQRQSWIVIVVPLNRLTQAQNDFAGCVRPGDHFGGRTMILPKGGRVSLVSSCAALFVPEGTPFDLLPLLWSSEDAATIQELKQWHKASRSQVSGVV